jgi:NADPH2:quinone reductase
VSTGNFSVVGVLLSYSPPSLPMRRFGINSFPPETGPRVHAALCELVASGAIRPVVSRRVRMDEVAGALEDHRDRRTTGRTVVDVAAS